MYTMLSDSNAVAAKKSLDVMIELYRRNIWKDAKTVNVISTACFSPVPKVYAMTHFLVYEHTRQGICKSAGKKLEKSVILLQKSTLCRLKCA